MGTSFKPGFKNFKSFCAAPASVVLKVNAEKFTKKYEKYYKYTINRI